MAFARVAYKNTANAVCRVKYRDAAGKIVETKVHCGCTGHAKPCAQARDLAKQKTREIKRARKSALPVTVLGVAEVFDRWLAVKASELDPKSAARYKSYVAAWVRWLRDQLGATAFADLSEDLLRRYKVGRETELKTRAARGEADEREIERRVNKTMYGELTQLRAAFAWAIAEGYWVPPANRPLTFDPAKAIKRPRVGKGTPKPLTEDEKNRLLATLAGNPRLSAAACLALYCGARREGVLSLRVADVDFGQRQLVLREKNAKDRTMPMHPRVEAALRAYPPVDPVYWFGEPTAEGFNEFSQTFCSLLRQVTGRRRVFFHHLRHTFATRFLEAHPNELATLQDLMGHAALDMVRVYAKVADERRRATLMAVPD